MTATATAITDDSASVLIDLLRGRRVVVLTGAGCSTESGIPDYRGPETARRARNPIQGREFIRDPMVQKRYWARAFVGWSRFSSARPNAAHLALAALEEAGIVRGIITQNVDRLHRAAGSRRVVELHGALAEVVCLDCGELEDRAALQERLSSLNPMFAGVIAEAVPDGDAELSLDRVRGFEIACCLACGGVLKPRVVFFGENVAKPVVDEAFSMLHESEVLLVVGSSLTVFSGYRFVRRAAERAMPVAIVNLGPTRGDAHATVCVDAAAGRVLPTLARALGASGRA